MTNDIKDWSLTPASNDTADPGINWQEGMAPSAVNNSGRGMMAAIKSWWDESLGGRSAYGAETGAADLYAIAPAPAAQAYAAGLSFHFFATSANTGASTLNINGLGAKAIQKNGAALVSGDIGSGDLVRVVYDGTAFQWQSTPLNPSFNEITATSGIKLGGVDPVNLLDTYEEAGTWTPSFDGQNGSPTSITYSKQLGKYTRIGNLVTVSFDVRITAVTLGAAAGVLQVKGLPFLSGQMTTYQGAVGNGSGWVSGSPQCCDCIIGGNITRMWRQTGTGWTLVVVTELTGNESLFATYTYFA